VTGASDTTDRRLAPPVPEPPRSVVGVVAAAGAPPPPGDRRPARGRWPGRRGPAVGAGPAGWAPGAVASSGRRRRGDAGPGDPVGRCPGSLAPENKACFPGMSRSSRRRGPSSSRSAGAQNRARFPRGSGASLMAVLLGSPGRRGELSRRAGHRRRAGGRGPGRPRPRGRWGRAGECTCRAGAPRRIGSTCARAGRAPSARSAS